MSWLDILEDSHAIRAVYGDDLPSLGWVTLHELSIHRDGPRATLRFDLASYPAYPPKKWQEQGFNVVQVLMDIFPVEEVVIRDFDVESRIDLHLKRNNLSIEVIARGSTKFYIVGHHLMIGKISAYCDPSLME